MNLILRPLNDVNDVTWSVIILMVILLFGVGYYIVMILRLSFQELDEEDEV
jgi:Mg2+ and Co2+ transporter CorA